MGWKAPSTIQAEAILHALQAANSTHSSRRNLIGLAQTESGKTDAFALPIIQAQLDHRKSFALVLSPTRELAIQMAEQFEALGSGIGLVCSVLVGAVDRMKQVISLAKRPHIVVATSGRLQDHFTDTKGFSVKNLKYLVQYEADQLHDVKLEKTFEDITNVIPKQRKTFVLSATINDCEGGQTETAHLRDPVTVSDRRNPYMEKVASKYCTVDTLRQEFYFVIVHHKDCYLVHVLSEIRGTMIMIFVRTCESTELLALTLRNLGFKAVSINGRTSQEKRLGGLNRFKTKDFNILVCTGVASRGVDMKEVDVVINYDISINPKVTSRRVCLQTIFNVRFLYLNAGLCDYVHRVSRTVRAGLSRYAVSNFGECKKGAVFQGKEIKKRMVDEVERMSEAKRMALRKRRRADDDDEEQADDIAVV